MGMAPHRRSLGILLVVAHEAVKDAVLALQQVVGVVVFGQVALLDHLRMVNMGSR